MRNPQIRQRANERRTGRVTQTQQEGWRRAGSASYSSSSSGASQVMFEDYTSADYTGTGPYEISWPHGLGTSAYIWHVIKLNTNGAVIVEDFWQGDDELILRFTGNTLSIRVIITA